MLAARKTTSENHMPLKKPPRGKNSFGSSIATTPLTRATRSSEAGFTRTVDTPGPLLRTSAPASVRACASRSGSVEGDDRTTTVRSLAFGALRRQRARTGAIGSRERDGGTTVFPDHLPLAIIAFW